MDSALQADILRGSVGVIALFIVLSTLWLSGKIRSEREVVDRDKTIERLDTRLGTVTTILQEAQDNQREQQAMFRQALDMLERHTVELPTQKRNRSSTPPPRTV